MRIADNRTHTTTLEAAESLAGRGREAAPVEAERVQNARQMPRVNPEIIADILRIAKELTSRVTQARQHEADSNPELSKLGPQASYGEVDSELFGAEGPQLRDIKQGRIGDCYFLAAVGSLVANDPDAIREMIRDNGDGTYSVRFYRAGEPVWIHVDSELPVDDQGRLVYAKGVDSDGDKQLEIWVGLLEKAYAKFRDRFSSNEDVEGYGEIDDGGHSDTVMKALTGQKAERFGVLASTDEFAAALGATNDGRLMTIQTKAGAADGWVGNHVYTVVGTYEKDGETYVILRNTWGSTEPDGSEPMGGANDGTFAVPADELRSVARRVYSGEAPAEEAWKPWSAGVRLVA
jgi:Calpain family cysteine protease